MSRGIPPYQYLMKLVPRLSLPRHETPRNIRRIFLLGPNVITKVQRGCHTGSIKYMVMIHMGNQVGNEQPVSSLLETDSFIVHVYCLAIYHIEDK